MSEMVRLISRIFSSSKENGEGRREAMKKNWFLILMVGLALGLWLSVVRPRKLPKNRTG